MFADRGYEAVTLRAIAKEIGYTHAVIYQHFPDKWHILAELSRETIGLPLNILHRKSVFLRLHVA
jgi:AcrR family transcriptional regulator